MIVWCIVAGLICIVIGLLYCFFPDYMWVLSRNITHDKTEANDNDRFGGRISGILLMVCGVLFLLAGLFGKLLYAYMFPILEYMRFV